MNRLAIAALLGCVVQFAAAHAQESPEPPSAPASPAAENGRYTYHPQQDTLLRLDSRTGQVATCTRGPMGWACQAAPEERAALDAEIGRLQAENAALKKQLAARGQQLPDATPGVPDKPLAEAPPRPPQPIPAPTSPMETEIARMRTVIGDIWKRLVEMVAELQRDIQRKS